jgi:tetratricopeptide (TPR) repeat protein
VDLDDVRRRAAALSDASTAGEIAALLDLTSPPLLPDDPYEPWTEPYRGDLQLQSTRLHLQLAALHTAAGAFDDAIDQYRAVVGADEFSEAAHLGLMRAYIGSDRRDLAMRAYDRYRELLSSELGTRPSEEVEALALELRRGVARTRLEDAIDEPVRAADAAMRAHAYAEAIARYREAIDRLRATEGDDEREARLWLKLATATSTIGTPIEVAECCRRAADLAERAGDFELVARALVRFQNATDATPNNNAGHREAAELIRAALARLPADAKASRAWLLAASARPFAASAREDNERHVTGRLSIAGDRDPVIEAQLHEAVALAREAASREILAYALTRLRTYITSPDTLDERLDLTREIMELTAGTRNAVTEMEARLFRHEDLLESGDIDGARIEARAMRRLGESVESSGIIAAGLSLQATHETADGQLTEARQTLRLSREHDERTGLSSNSQNRFGSQLLMLRWHAGRIGEMEPGFRRALDVFPRMTATRAALAFIYAESGDIENARAELALMPPVEAIPRDFSWWFIAVFTSCAAIATGATEIARSLYTMVLPFADRNASNASAVSFGSASLVLAQLAEHLRDLAAAERHFEHALAFNIRTRQRTWVAHTRYHYASMLFARCSAGDADRARELARIARADAHEIGMPALLAQIDALTNAGE